MYNGEFIEVKDLVGKPVVRKQSGELIGFLHYEFEVYKSVIRCKVLKTHIKCMKFGISMTEDSCCGLLGFDNEYSGRCYEHFRPTHCLHLQGREWRQCVPSKYW